MLKESYMQCLIEVDPDVYIDNYKTDKLKDKLKKCFGTKLKFWRSFCRRDLVYADDIARGQAEELAFELASSNERRVEKAAVILRRHII